MEENKGQGKQKRKRRELLIIVLFQLASISLCALSLIFKIGGPLAEEFVPIPMHAINVGDYSADDVVFRFRKANLAIIRDILLDHDPAAEDIADRSTAIAFNMLTPVPTITPNYADPSTEYAITPTSNYLIPPTNTPLPTNQTEVSPTSPGTENPTQAATPKPTSKPI